MSKKLEDALHDLPDINIFEAERLYWQQPTAALGKVLKLALLLQQECIFVPKMLPGEAPYTTEERQRVYAMFKNVAAVDDSMNSEELDELERSVARDREGNS